MSSRTAVACPEPPRRPNEPVAWTAGTTSSTGGVNVNVVWRRLNVKH